MDLDEFRRQKDHFYATSDESPLLPEQREGFDGLAYYSENEYLRFELEMDVYDDKESVSMPTSTGGSTDFLRWGWLSFEVEGEPVTLTVYAARGAGGFFLPFKDATSSKETYGGGRYVELQPLDDGRYRLDFNLAYNPYCAYNDRWTCAYPPSENHLSVPIRAGEKKYDG